MVKALADYEKLSDLIVFNEEDLDRVLFGPHAKAEVLLARVEHKSVGYAVFFHNISTFQGRSGMYLEDLFVKPKFRNKGIGKALLKAVAKIAQDRSCGRFEWLVLDWNTPAKNFYIKLGAEIFDDFRLCRLSGEALADLARDTDH